MSFIDHCCPSSSSLRHFGIATWIKTASLQAQQWQKFPSKPSLHGNFWILSDPTWALNMILIPLRNHRLRKFFLC